MVKYKEKTCTSLSQTGASFSLYLKMTQNRTQVYASMNKSVASVWKWSERRTARPRKEASDSQITRSQRYGQPRGEPTRLLGAHVRSIQRYLGMRGSRNYVTSYTEARLDGKIGRKRTEAKRMSHGQAIGGSVERASRESTAIQTTTERADTPARSTCAQCTASKDTLSYAR